MKPELSLSEQILMSLSTNAKAIIPDPLQAYLPALVFKEVKHKLSFIVIYERSAKPLCVLFILW